MNNYNWLFDLEQPNLAVSNAPQAHENLDFDAATGTLSGKHV